MALNYINTGTASVTNGATTITFADVSAALFKAGDLFLQGGSSGILASVDNDAGTAELVEAWGGSTSAALAYTVMTIPVGAELAASTRTIMQYLAGPLLTIAAMTGVDFPANGSLLVAQDGDWVATNSVDKLGIGMSPTNVLDITQSQNGNSVAQLTNIDAGASAQASLHLYNGAEVGALRLYGHSFSGGASYEGAGATILLGTGDLNIVATGAHPIKSFVNGTLATQVGTDGSFLVGTTTNGGWLGSAVSEIKSSSNKKALSVYAAGTNDALAIRVDSASLALAAFYYNGATLIGTITTNGSSTSYNTSSDLRLKDNVQDATDAGAIIDSLRVRQWDWKSNQQHEAFGFVAQEMALVYAPAITAGDDDPNTITRQWGRDDSKLVPLLVKEVQSLRTRVAALESAP